ncbi:methionine synthase [Propionibacteriaceae bacterium Y2011]|uniref:methionine synthase n=1 Tax=Microlunatus sp. Y2014 TaxID=3418488 RepID=UPI003B4A2D02
MKVTQIGSWPGTDMGVALGESFQQTPDLPVLPELPDRGASAGMIGRATAFLAGLDVDLQPAGWRLNRGTSRDMRVTRQLLRDDLDQLEERAQGWTGSIKVAVAGPWTLSANLEKPMGEKVLSDHGARRDVAASLAEGVSGVIDDLTRRLPEVSWVVQLDEPMLGMVSSGEVRTASGLHRYRTVDEPELVESLGVVVDALARRDEAGPTVWVHSCGADVPVSSLLRLPEVGLSLDDALITRGGWDAIGSALEAGRIVALGVSGPAAGRTARAVGPDALATHVLRRLEALGLGPEVSDNLWLTPACGLAGVSRADAVRTLEQLRTAAGIVTETLAG